MPLWWALFSCACDEVTLVRGLSAEQARELSAALNRRGVAVNREADGAGDRYALHIAPSAVSRAWDARDTRCGAAAPEPEPAPAPLIPTREAEQRSHELTLGRQLARAIEQLPAVRSATVVLSLPSERSDLSALLEPLPRSPASALVTVTYAAGMPPPAAAQIRELVAAGATGIARDAIRVHAQPSDRPEPACAELSRVGPITLTRESVPTLKLWIAASLVVHMLTSLSLLFVLQRRRRL